MPIISKKEPLLIWFIHLSPIHVNTIFFFVCLLYKSLDIFFSFLNSGETSMPDGFWKCICASDVAKGNVKFQLDLNGLNYIKPVYIFMPNDHGAAVRWQWETINIAYTKVIWLFGNVWWMIHFCREEVSVIMSLFFISYFTIIKISDACMYISAAQNLLNFEIIR